METHSAQADTAKPFMQPQMFFGPGQQPAFLPPGARGQMPFPQGMPAQAGRGAGFPGGMPPQQGGRGGPAAAQQIPPAMYGMPAMPAMPPGAFPPGAYNPAYLQLAQAAQQAMGGRGAGARGPMMPMPGMPPQMPGAVPAMRGGQAYPPQAGRGAVPGRPGQMPGFPQGRGMLGQMGQAQQPPATGGLDMAVLNAAPPAQQKQMLGEALYPKILEQQPELAGKITGMLLEMDNAELLNL